MAEDVLNPFTEDDFNAMEQAIARAGEIETAIKKAQSAGIDLPGLLEDNRVNRDRLRKILSTYKPGR